MEMPPLPDLDLFNMEMANNTDAENPGLQMMEIEEPQTPLADLHRNNTQENIVHSRVASRVSTQSWRTLT